MTETGALTASRPRTAASGIRTERRFYFGIGLALLVIVIWGFTRSFYLRPLFAYHHALDLSGTASVPALVLLHGGVMTAWFALFFAQVWLARTGRIGVHRQLGIAAAIVAGLLVITAAGTMILSIPRFDRAHVPREVTEQVMFVDSLALLWFTLFVGTAIRLRRRPDVHKRLMMLASIAILPPALARIGEMLGPQQVIILGGPIALWLALAIHDAVTCKRLHRATVIGGLLVIVANPLLMAWLATVNARYGFVDALGRMAYALTPG